MSGRCDCCNAKLSEYEMTLRHAATGEFIGTCLKCLDGLNIPTFGRDDLDQFESVEDEVFDNGNDEEF